MLFCVILPSHAYFNASNLQDDNISFVRKSFTKFFFFPFQYFSHTVCELFEVSRDNKVAAEVREAKVCQDIFIQLKIDDIVTTGATERDILILQNEISQCWRS